MKTNDEFEALTGTPKRSGKNNPNSMTNRVLNQIPTDGAYNLNEITESVLKANKKKKFNSPDKKQIKTLISNLVNKKDKNGISRVEIKNDQNDNNEPYFRQVSEGG